MNLRIEHPDPEPYEVEDYDFIFANGMQHSQSVAKTLGDTVDWDTSPTAVIFNLAEKPSPSNPDGKIPSERLTVLLTHVIMISRRTRTVTPPTFRERDLFQQQMLPKLPTSIN